MRHSAAHVMAHAIKNLWPDARFGIGPTVEGGFYYDIDITQKLTPADLPRIEEEMRKIIKADEPFTKREHTIDEALAMFRASGQKFKVELIGDLRDQKGARTVTTYQEGAFTDLCRGPHVDKAGRIKAFKLLSVAGAYWRGSEKNPQLQRIYGTAFFSKEELDKHLKMLDEAMKRDHRRLGRELDLYSTHEEAGPGLIYWHPKGARIRAVIEDFWRKAHYAGGYDLLYTPHMGRDILWKTSGHLDFYSENMYSPMNVDERKYFIKPMNCPFHIMIYKTGKRSYRELPLRWAELGTVYRYERSGVLHGLLRVRGFTQDDAHIFCTPAQMESEIREVLRFSLKIWKAFGFGDIKAYLATRPAKSVAGSDDMWNAAIDSLKKAIEAENLKHEIDPGGGAFYGPKIDLKVRDALGREWQMTTIQFDFNLPERFDMTFVDQDGKEKRPFMIHRALLGSLERFFGVLIEHYGGAFPVWLAPVQARLIPISDSHSGYCKEFLAKLKAAGLRAEVDTRNETMGFKTRDAQTSKIPFSLVAGDRETAAGSFAVRKYGEKESRVMPMDGIIAMLRELDEAPHRALV
ncbi:MAG: threonine--tRNA ligase [Bdellovibrionales bacterium RIFOXYD1_FULL_53_11]|nr:MAG: threonine--tRNA ligase [Bdellovibrionales bacterium RIFOXYD1_FULL_53_11]